MNISMIIPAYNSGKYISKCIESILHQTEKEFELIIVDDGSSDDTVEIVSKYSSLDKRIKLISKKNEGVSSARNCGIDNASGDYIVFIDSDDWVPCDMLAKMKKAISSGETDIVMGKMYHMDSRRGTIRSHELKAPLSDCVVNPVDPARLKKTIVGYAFHKGVAYSCLAKIYKREIIENYGLRFDPDISFCEDVLFNIAFFRHVRDVKVVDECFYYAIDNENSLTKRYSSEMPIILYKVYTEMTHLFYEKGFLDQALQVNIDIQYLNDVWDLVFRLMAGRYVNISQPKRIKMASSILKKPEFVSLMKKYRHLQGICGTSFIGKIASHVYLSNHVDATVRILFFLIRIRGLINSVVLD